MAIKKAPNKTWMYDVRHPVTKRRIRVSGFTTKTEAEQAVANLKAKWRRSQFGIEADLSSVRLNLREEIKKEVAIMLDEYRETGAPTIYNTAVRAESYLPLIPENLKVTDLRPDHLAAIRDFELSRDIKETSAHTYMVNFRTILTRIKRRNEFALSNWMIPKIDMPEGTTNIIKRRVWTQDEFERVLNVIDNPRENYPDLMPHSIPTWRDVGDILRLAASTGMRKTEMLTLTWNQIHFGSRIISARTLKQKKSRRGRHRDIPMNDTVYEMLRRRRAEIAEQFGREELLVFPRWRVDPRGYFIYRVLRKACKIAGVAYGDGSLGVVLHGLRHTAATTMIAGGTDISTASEILGHTIQTMLENYSHSTIDSKRRAVEKLHSPSNVVDIGRGRKSVSK